MKSREGMILANTYKTIRNVGAGLKPAPTHPPIVRLSSRRSQGRGMSVIRVVAEILILINVRSISLCKF